jgi:hypothetical protein
MMAAVNQIAQFWWGWMGPMSWQVSLLILNVTGLDFLLRRWAWPQVRYTLSSSSFLRPGLCRAV